jgi:hypothetical protein
MRCRSARSAAVERGLGLLSPPGEAALDLHLARCPACARAVRAEERLVEQLAALGETPSLEVDVTARVLAGLPPFDRVPREDVPARQLGWAGAVAALGAIVVAGSFGGRLPEIEVLLQSAATIAFNLLGFADALLEPLWALLSVPFRFLGALGESLIELSSRATSLAPVARVTVALGYVAMASTVVLVLIRDLRRPAVGLPREGN